MEGKPSGSGDKGPDSSKSKLVLARRPGFGSLGNPVAVCANHFRVKFQPKQLYHYDVTISPEVPKGLNRVIVDQFVKDYKDEKLNGAIPAYDGQRALYTARAAVSEQIEVEVELPETDDTGVRRRNRKFKVMLREASRPNLYHLADFLSGRVMTLPQEALQALDIVLRETAVKFFIPRGRSFYGSHFGVNSLGDGVQAYRGFYQSIRPAQDGLLTLNLDIAAAPFYEAVLLPDFLAEVFHMDPRDLQRELARPDARGDTNRVKTKKLLKGLRVETIHSQNAKRKYRIQSISNQPLSTLMFDLNGERSSVVDYFARTYNYRIRLTELPAIESGTKDKKRYLPMEVCRIVAGQPFMKAMNDAQRSALLAATCTNPRERMGTTEQISKELLANTHSIIEEFGVKVNRFLTPIPARVLPSPRIVYQSMEENPRDGHWNMRGKRIFEGCKIKTWSLINFSPNLYDRAVETFCCRLPQECNNYGLPMNPQMATPWISENSGNVEKAVNHLYRTCKQNTGEDLQLIICVMPQTDNKSIYATVKRTCEIELGLVTQCCLSDHIRKCNPMYIANVILKINAKLGGYNALLVDEMRKKLPLISDVPTIIIGADVSHPRVGDDYSPSICAVTASMDWPHFSKYEAIVRSQRQRSELLEELFWEKEDGQGRKHTGGIIKDLLHSFEERSGYSPERIIYYRDGVSDGQFEAVLNHEFDSVKKACEALGWGSQPQGSMAEGEPMQKRQRSTEKVPKITFIVVQKRHHTRFFPEERGPSTRSGNIIPGTVVDSIICHPSQFDFFLCSHEGIKGTSRPAHYHVLKDENGFAADEIQRLSNDLCFTYARCTRAVSIVPPCYYAHLAATRARLWIGSDSSPSDSGSHQEGASSIGSGGTRARAGPMVRPLPLLHERIKGSMFFI